MCTPGGWDQVLPVRSPCPISPGAVSGFSRVPALVSASDRPAPILIDLYSSIPSRSKSCFSPRCFSAVGKYLAISRARSAFHFAFRSLTRRLASLKLITSVPPNLCQYPVFCAPLSPVSCFPSPLEPRVSPSDSLGDLMDRGDFTLSTLSKPEHSGLVIVTWGAFRDPGVCVPTR